MAVPTLKISIKIPAIVILAALIATLITGINSYQTTSSLLVQAATDKLTALMKSRKSALGDYLSSIHEDLVVTASSDEVVDAVIHFQKDFAIFAKAGNPVAPLQKIYIQDNPNKLGEKHKMANAPDGSDYSKIRGLNETAQKIGDVVSMITDIAEQTNLLALNATIEATRAGDAGKGFAVVASEVKNLANQTATATDQISNQIKKIQIETQESADAIESITGTITSIDEVVTSISAAVEEQGAATSEIAQTVEPVNGSSKLVANRIAKVTQNSAHTYGSAIKVLWASDDLDKPLKIIKTELDEFLKSAH